VPVSEQQCRTCDVSTHPPTKTHCVITHKNRNRRTTPAPSSVGLCELGLLFNITSACFLFKPNYFFPSYSVVVQTAVQSV
jgi:hypothetical protein